MYSRPKRKVAGSIPAMHDSFRDQKHFPEFAVKLE